MSIDYFSMSDLDESSVIELERKIQNSESWRNRDSNFMPTSHEKNRTLA